MSEWPTIPLSKTTSFIVDNRGRTAPTTESGIPLIATNCIDSRDLYPSYKNVRYVSQPTYETWFRSHLEPNDIILTLKGSQNGATYLVPSPVDFVIAQDMVALRVNKKVMDHSFLLEALRSDAVQSEIKNLDVSGVIPHLKKSDFDKLQIPCPPLPVQQAIGNNYLDFCLKIDLLNRQNKTLEAMAETLFRQWFVEEASDDWEEGTLSDVAINIRNSVSSDRINPDARYVGLEHIARRSIALDQFGLGAAVASNKYAFQANDVLFGKLRPYFHKVCLAPFSGVCSTDILVIRPTRKNLLAFCLFAFFQDDVVEFANLSSGGTRMPRTDWGSLGTYAIKLPDDQTLSKFNELVLPLIDKIYCNLKSIDTLVRLRDTLLPKLMSGEVRVHYE